MCRVAATPRDMPSAARFLSNPLRTRSRRAGLFAATPNLRLCREGPAVFIFNVQIATVALGDERARSDDRLRLSVKGFRLVQTLGTVLVHEHE